ncbi:chemotaxis signal transduction protein [Yoonia maricola]|uniref:Chemotaxis signal transduction protein n=1 Tax=Yoonia maricola TaxID=420999 RepID=A0A2M8WKH4_9RHOB|nr:chemotaxis protein CheW [Yoonia maricola]PJI91422.1 chemotaxis signal transduction protein [Yoonia maricola]
MTETSHRQFGIMQIGDTLLGVPIEHLSEVLHVHKELQLPQKSALLCGGIELRGQLVPVLDLQQLGHLPSTDPQSRFGVILENDRHILAIFVDQIVGIATIAPADIQRIAGQNATAPPLFQDVFTYEGQFVSLLDVAAIFALPDIYAVARQHSTSDQTRRILDPMLTFAAGGALYTVPAVEVYAAIHKQTIQRTAITVGPCLGEISYHGRRIPVLCPVRILGLGTPVTAQMTEVVALRFPGDLILGFAVEAIHEIDTLATAKETTLPIWQADRNFIAKIIIRDDGSQVYAVDLATIHGAKDLQEIATLSKPDTPPAEDSPAQDSQTENQNVTITKERYLVVAAPEKLAIPLSQVNCIVKQPDRLTATDVSKPGFRGYFSRSDESIALFDLSECMGQSAIDNPQAKILLTGGPGHQVGYLVDRVVSIEMSEWCENPSKDPAKQSKPLVQLGTGAKATVLPMCRLPDMTEGGTERLF